MRSLLLLSVSILFLSSCSNQEEIEKYQKQLRESNEALEEIIGYRRVNLLNRARENPAKGQQWYDLGQQIISITKTIINEWEGYDNKVAVRIDSLNALIKSHHPNLEFSSDLYLLSKSDTLALRNDLLLFLNKSLQFLDFSTRTSEGLIILNIQPIKFRNEDSTLVVLNSNFIPPTQPQITLTSPKGIEVKPLVSIGYFKMDEKTINLPISGSVEFSDHTGLKSFRIDFSDENASQNNTSFWDK